MSCVRLIESSVAERRSYVRIFFGVWPNVSEWVEAFVELTPTGWHGVGSVSLPNESREQWNTRKQFESRDDAANFAADFVAEAERIVSSVQRGDGVHMPHRAMMDSCNEYIAGHREIRNAYNEADAAAGWRQASAVRQRANKLREELTHAWYREHDWRDFK